MKMYTLRIAFRNIYRNKLNTILNIVTLAPGLCSVIVIYLIISYEFSFDRQHAGSKQIYTVHMVEQLNKNDKPVLLPSIKPELADEIRTSVTGFSAYAPYHILNDARVAIPGVQSIATFNAQPVFTNPDYFNIFNYRWIAGSKEFALSTPNHVVLTEKRAKKYFGTSLPSEVMNKRITYNDSLTVTVAGLLSDPSNHTDFFYQEFISLSSANNKAVSAQLQLHDSKGIPYSSRLIFKLTNNTPIENVEKSIDKVFSIKYKNENYPEMAYVPLKDFHFTTFAGVTKADSTNLNSLYILSGIALFILLLAVSNYVNLATAEAMTREKNIAIRKVIGSSHGKLLSGFLTESLLTITISLVLGCFLVNPVLRLMNSYISPEIGLHIWDPVLWLFLSCTLIVITLLAGLYPAWVLASSKTISVTRIPAQYKSSSTLLRKGMTVFQFTMALIFIILSLGIGRQISFMTGGEKGFTSKAILSVSTDLDNLSKVKVLARNLEKVSGVEMIAKENIPPMGTDRGFFTIQYESSDKEMVVAAVKTDENYIPLYGMKLVAGRNLFPSDTMKEFVINETLVKQLGLHTPGDAIGKKIFAWGKWSPVIGVVADFHQASFHETILPQVITTERCSNLAIRINAVEKPGTSLHSILERIKNSIKATYPDAEYSTSFFQDDLKNLYKKEENTLKLIHVSTSVAIFISAISLFGLTIYSVRKRMKEISIRKVLGASASQILVTLNGDFFKVMVLAFICASPIALFLFIRWLQDYAYRVTIHPILFFGAGVIALLVGCLTICLTTIQVALANPIDSLRND